MSRKLGITGLPFYLGGFPVINYYIIFFTLPFPFLHQSYPERVIGVYGAKLALAVT